MEEHKLAIHCRHFSIRDYDIGNNEIDILNFDSRVDGYYRFCFVDRLLAY